jgi:hypothetical protein
MRAARPLVGEGQVPPPSTRRPSNGFFEKQRRESKAPLTPKDGILFDVSSIRAGQRTPPVSFGEQSTKMEHSGLLGRRTPTPRCGRRTRVATCKLIRSAIVMVLECGRTAPRLLLPSVVSEQWPQLVTLTTCAPSIWEVRSMIQRITSRSAIRAIPRRQRGSG